MTDQEVGKALESHKFTFAKTMPDKPHEYTLKKDWANKELFADIVKYIRANGVPKYYGKWLYKYFYYNGHMYWTMSQYNADTTIIINRAKDDRKSLLLRYSASR